MREQAEYERLKAAFSIEGEGVGVQSLDEEAQRQLNHDFVEAIREVKLISLERLCVMFDMKTDVSWQSVVIHLHSSMASNSFNFVGLRGEDPMVDFGGCTERRPG